MLQVQDDLLLIEHACQQVFCSQELKLLLHCLLDGGNYLNEGTNRASALGMSCASSCKLHKIYVFKG